MSKWMWCFSFEEGKSDKEILDNLLLSTRYDKRLLPPVQGTLRPPPSTRQLDDNTPDLDLPPKSPDDTEYPEHFDNHDHLHHHLRHHHHHKTAPHNHSSLLTPRRKGISIYKKKPSIWLMRLVLNFALFFLCKSGEFGFLSNFISNQIKYRKKYLPSDISEFPTHF